MIEEMKAHPLADIFPMLDAAATDTLRADIAAHGVREPIVLHEGMILDGRNRYHCARQASVEVETREFGSMPGDGDDPLAFVISTNLHRRHLTESQRASVAARLANMKSGDNQHSKGRANLHDLLGDTAAPKVSTSSAADMLNVSERSVKTARKVQETAPAEIVRAVDEGRISVSLAAEVAELPEQSKAEVIAAPPEKQREVARAEVKKAHVSHNSGNNEWYTPPAFIEAARRVMGGIDLDPATSEIANRTVQAAQIFTAEDDGLAQEWPIGRIWMNPPYATPLIGQFSERLAQEVMRGSEAIVLVNNATETGWFQRMASAASAICFPSSRIRFLDPTGKPSGSPLQGQAFIYFGGKPESFAVEFSEFGFVVEVRK